MSRIFYFEIHRAPSELLLPSAKKICPERQNWPDRLAGISKGAQWISKKKLDNFLSSFKLKMMVKISLDFFILKFYVPLQRYLLTCQANSAVLGRFFCTGQQATLKGHVGFQNKKF